MGNVGAFGFAAASSGTIAFFAPGWKRNSTWRCGLSA
jgi:hypothetical protein